MLGITTTKAFFARLVCRIIGHYLFICDTCQRNTDNMWTFGQVFKWTCETDGCGKVCSRCDEKFIE